MSTSCIRRFRLGKFPPPATLPTTHFRRNLHATTPRRDVAALDPPTLDVPHASTSTLARADPLELIKAQKLREMELALKGANQDYNYTWSRYIDLLNLVGADEVPLEIHQGVLRNCSFGPWQARKWLTRRLAQRRRPAFAHPHERRFQSIIYNMRSAGYTPTIHDYHYILQHFASVGHYTGALQVLREIRHLGIARASKTYRLCFVAMCHRLSLPCYHTARDALVKEVSKYCTRLLRDMWDDGIAVRPGSVALCMRIFKESMDLEGFERFMKVAYAIDLSYPDRPPLEFWSPTLPASSTGHALPIAPAQPLPFSTSALNTALDFLGSLGEVSRMVQTFEVLTTPLRSTAAAAPSSSFEDDEDDDFGDSNPAVAPFTPPHALPNSTTYYLLLKWVSSAGHATLARHYLLQAMHLDFVEDRRLRGDCERYSPGEILAPHFAVSRRMVLPVFAEANRDKNMQLLRWVHLKLQRILRRKRAHVAFYTRTKERWEQQLGVAQRKRGEDVSAEPIEPRNANESSEGSKPSPEPPIASVAPTDTSVPGAPAAGPAFSVRPPGRPAPRPREPKMLSSFADLDVDRDELESPVPRYFNIDDHLWILRRDTEALESLERYIVSALGRNTQRLKERLGRRVWGQQDIYVRSVGARMKVGRNTWTKIVNFRPNREPSGHTRTPVQMLVQREGQPGHVAANIGFFTPSAYAERVNDGPPRGEHVRPLPPHLKPARGEAVDRSLSRPSSPPPDTSTEGPENKKLE